MASILFRFDGDFLQRAYRDYDRHFRLFSRFQTRFLRIAFCFLRRCTYHAVRRLSFFRIRLIRSRVFRDFSVLLLHFVCRQGRSALRQLAGLSISLAARDRCREDRVLYRLRADFRFYVGRIFVNCQRLNGIGECCLIASNRYGRVRMRAIYVRQDGQYRRLDCHFRTDMRNLMDERLVD